MDLASVPLPSSRPLASSNIGWGWDLTTKALPAANKQLSRIAAAKNATGQSTHQKLRTTRRLPMASMASASTSDRFSLVPPPPVFDLPAPATEEQQTKRAKTMADIQTISASACEASTVATYSKALCISIHNIAREIGADLLPLDSTGKIMLLLLRCPVWLGDRCASTNRRCARGIARAICQPCTMLLGTTPPGSFGEV